MAIIFHKVERGNPMNTSAPKKWYTTLKTISRIGEKEVAKQIADETTLNRKEAEMAISQLQKVLLSNLLASNSVQLGDWGSFHLTCNSEGSATRDEVTANNIKNLNVRFTPGKELQDALKSATFISADKL